MATKKSAAKKAPTTKAAKAENTGASDTSNAPVATLPKGKGTQNDAPPPSNPDPIPRGGGEKEPKERKEDTLRRSDDKARWNYGVSADDTAELLREQRQIDADNKQ
jgi:hypothetical protein